VAGARVVRKRRARREAVRLVAHLRLGAPECVLTTRGSLSAARSDALRKVKTLTRIPYPRKSAPARYRRAGFPHPDAGTVHHFENVGSRVRITAASRAAHATMVGDVAGTVDDPIEIDIENPEFRRALRKKYRELDVEVNGTRATASRISPDVGTSGDCD